MSVEDRPTDWNQVLIWLANIVGALLLAGMGLVLSMMLDLQQTTCTKVECDRIEERLRFVEKDNERAQERSRNNEARSEANVRRLENMAERYDRDHVVPHPIEKRAAPRP